jgi:hypothetical protein
MYQISYSDKNGNKQEEWKVDKDDAVRFAQNLQGCTDIYLYESDNLRDKKELVYNKSDSSYIIMGIVILYAILAIAIGWLKALFIFFLIGMVVYIPYKISQFPSKKSTLIAAIVFIIILIVVILAFFV